MAGGSGAAKKHRDCIIERGGGIATAGIICWDMDIVRLRTKPVVEDSIGDPVLRKCWVI